MNVQEVAKAVVHIMLKSRMAYGEGLDQDLPTFFNLNFSETRQTENAELSEACGEYVNSFIAWTGNPGEFDESKTPRNIGAWAEMLGL